MRHVTTALFAGAIAVPALAGSSTFSDRANFEAAAAASGIALNLESFEGFPLDPGSAERDSVDADDFLLEGVNEGFEFLPPLSILGPTGPGGTFATDGNQHVNVGSLFNSGLNNDVVVTFTFDTPQNAFFVDITDLLGLDQAPNPQATLTSDNGDFIQLLDGQGSDPNINVGFINPGGFTTVTLRSTAGDSFGLDAVAYGIPTPGAASLLALAGLGVVRRRR
jgi:hypothetical protein